MLILQTCISSSICIFNSFRQRSHCTLTVALLSQNKNKVILFRVESTLTSTVIPFSVSIVVWCQGTPCSLAVFSRATVVLASLVHEWEHAAVSGSRALSTRAYWKVKSDRVFRVMTVLYVLRQRVTTACDMFQQPTTFNDSALRVTTKCYVLRQWVA